MATIIGPRPSLVSVSWPGEPIGEISNHQRAYSPLIYQAPQAGFIVAIGAIVREISDTNPSIYGVVWALDQDGTPGDQLGRTALSAINGTQDWQRAVAWSDPDLKGALTAIRLVAGQRFAVGVKNQSGTIELGRASGSTLSWRRSVSAASPPTDPFGPTSTGMVQPPLMYVVFEPNRDPVTALTAPADGSSVNTTTPVITGTFTDPDQPAPQGDRMAGYGIQVVRDFDGQEMWGGAGAVFAANATERSSNIFSRMYSGNPLAAGTGPYTVQAFVVDDSGAQSPLSAPRSFSINAAGQVVTDDAVNPPEKVEGASNLIDWDAKWTHPTALAMNAARVRVRIGSTRTVIKEGFLVTKAVVSSAPPGTAFTIQDTEAGIGTLEPGEYQYDVQGRATDGQFSPWSGGRSFVVNAPPTMPSNLQPPNGSSSTNRPELRWRITDPDEDFASNGQSRVQFQRPNGTTYEEVTTEYDTVEQEGFLQTDTTSVLEAVKGKYMWRVRGEDISAGILGYGPWSGWQAFYYTSGPDVDIVSPATNGAIVTTSTPTIAWTAPGQVRYRVEMFAEGAEAAFRAKDGVGSGTTFRIPAGWLVNNRDYDVAVSAWDSLNNKGTSLRRNFRVRYTGPVAPVNIQASAFANRLDPVFMGVREGSTAFISWLESTINPGEFGGYIVRRRYAGQDFGDSLRFPTITTIGQPMWWDHMAPPNVPLIYAVSQLRKVSASEVLESAVSEVTITLERQVPILCSTSNPGDLRVSAMWMDGPALRGGYTRDQSLEKTWGSGQKRIHMAPPAAYGARRVQFTITMRADERADLDTHIDAVDDLVESGHTLLWSPRRNRERMFCVIEGDSDWQMDNVGTRTRTLRLVETDYIEGLSEDLVDAAEDA